MIMMFMIIVDCNTKCHSNTKIFMYNQKTMCLQGPKSTRLENKTLDLNTAFDQTQPLDATQQITVLVLI